MSHTESNQIGRPIRVVSISFANGKTLEEVVDVVDSEGAKGTDLIALPETWLGQTGHEPETLAGPTVTAMAGDRDARRLVYLRQRPHPGRSDPPGDQRHDYAAGATPGDES